MARSRREAPPAWARRAIFHREWPGERPSRRCGGAGRDREPRASIRPGQICPGASECRDAFRSRNWASMAWKGACRAGSDIRDARSVAETISVPHYALESHFASDMHSSRASITASRSRTDTPRSSAAFDSDIASSDRPATSTSRSAQVPPFLGLRAPCMAVQSSKADEIPGRATFPMMPKSLQRRVMA